MTTDTELSASDDKTISELADEADIDENEIRTAISTNNVDAAFSAQTTHDRTKTPTSIPSRLKSVLMAVLNWLFLVDHDYISHADVTDFYYDDQKNTLTITCTPIGSDDVQERDKQFNLDNESERNYIQRLLGCLNLPVDKPSSLESATIPIRTYTFGTNNKKIHSRIEIPSGSLFSKLSYRYKRINQEYNLYSVANDSGLGLTRRYFLSWGLITFGVGLLSFPLDITTWHTLLLVPVSILVLSLLVGMLFLGIYILILTGDAISTMIAAIFHA